MSTLTATPLLINTLGNIVPENTHDICCICGEPIPKEDYRGGGLHDGITYMADGTRRFVFRQTHLRCSPSLNPIPLW